MDPTHYHIVYVQGGHYKTLPVADEFEAHHLIYALSAKSATAVLGVFDARDGQFHWSIEEKNQPSHKDQVAIICQRLE